MKKRIPPKYLPIFLDTTKESKISYLEKKFFIDSFLHLLHDS
jgi:hypothetical protein